MPPSSHQPLASTLDLPATVTGPSPSRKSALPLRERERLPATTPQAPAADRAAFTEERTPAQGTVDLGTDAVAARPASESRWQGEKTLLLPTAKGQAEALWLEDMADGQWHEVARFPALLGRGEGSAVPLAGESLSRLHAHLHAVSGGFAIEDAGSLNGLSVNGYRLRRVLLAEGDVIELGGVRLQVHLRGPVGKGPVGKGPAARRRTPEAARWRGRLARLLGLCLLVGGFYAWEAWVNSRVAITPAVAQAPAAREIPAAPLLPATEPLGDPATASTTTPKADPADVKAAASAVPKAAATEGDSAIPAPASPDPLPAAAAEETTAPAPAKPPAPTRFSATHSQARLAAAQADYLAGRAPQALKTLRAIGRSRRHRAPYREKAQQLGTELKGLYAEYEAGRTALASGDPAGAFAAWQRFLRGEQALYLAAPSAYAQEVTRAVVAEYQARGDAAQAKGDSPTAYQAWSRAAQLDPESAAARSLTALQGQAQARYREGYREETVNLKKAHAHWRAVLELVPPDSEYHIKARAKLRWYAHLGTL